MNHTPNDYIDFAMRINDNAIDALVYLGLLMQSGDSVAKKAYKILDRELRNQHR